MLSWIDQIDDERGELGLGPVVVEFAVHGIVHQAVAGCWRDADGHGCPTLPAEAVIVRIDVLRVVGAAGEIAIDGPGRERAANWIERHEDMERIEGYMLAEALTDG